MFSPDITAGAFRKVFGSTNPSSPPPNREASAVKGVVLTPVAMARIIAANERTFVAVTMKLFFFLCC